jgi:transposase
LVDGPAVVRTAGSAAEKKSLHAVERDTEANRKRRQEFLGRIRETPPERLIYLDESGVTTSMTRRYGRCVGGRRIHEATPGGHWKILTILSAMSTRGLIATMTIEEPTDAEIFLAYVEHLLCPALRPGDVVVMDNLSSHKAEGVRTWIENRGAELLYLPSYSPDLNPIEKAWAKLKQLLRSTKARTREALEQPSQIYCHKSLLKTFKPGSDSVSAHYNNFNIALACERLQRRRCSSPACLRSQPDGGPIDEETSLFLEAEEYGWRTR